MLIEEVLKCEPLTEEIAKRFHQRSDFLFLGRGINYPIALEGALKLKEISYIHAEGYPGRRDEARTDRADRRGNADRDDRPERSRLREDDRQHPGGQDPRRISDRTGRRSVTTGIKDLLDPTLDFLLTVPDAHPLITPVLMVIPLQLLAYHIAVRRGCDVDQPRNLAKSVTVE